MEIRWGDETSFRGITCDTTHSGSFAQCSVFLSILFLSSWSSSSRGCVTGSHHQSKVHDNWTFMLQWFRYVKLLPSYSFHKKWFTICWNKLFIQHDCEKTICSFCSRVLVSVWWASQMLIRKKDITHITNHIRPCWNDIYSYLIRCPDLLLIQLHKFCEITHSPLLSLGGRQASAGKRTHLLSYRTTSTQGNALDSYTHIYPNSN